MHHAFCASYFFRIPVHHNLFICSYLLVPILCVYMYMCMHVCILVHINCVYSFSSFYLDTWIYFSLFLIYLEIFKYYYYLAKNNNTQ